MLKCVTVINSEKDIIYVVISVCFVVIKLVSMNNEFHSKTLRKLKYLFSLPHSSNEHHSDFIGHSTLLEVAQDFGLVVSCPSPRAPPSENWSGEQSRICWAYYPKALP